MGTILAIVVMVNDGSADSFSAVLGMLLGGWILGIAFAGIPTGWRALNRITPDIFLILPIAGWIIFYLIKGTLALIVGIIMLPFKTIKGIVDYAKAKKLDNYVTQSYMN